MTRFLKQRDIVGAAIAEIRLQCGFGRQINRGGIGLVTIWLDPADTDGADHGSDSNADEMAVAA
jgi:hypothetical protein